jgi:hypothetical protein
VLVVSFSWTSSIISSLKSFKNLKTLNITAFRRIGLLSSLGQRELASLGQKGTGTYHIECVRLSSSRSVALYFVSDTKISA